MTRMFMFIPDSDLIISGMFDGIIPHTENEGHGAGLADEEFDWDVLGQTCRAWWAYEQEIHPHHAYKMTGSAGELWTLFYSQPFFDEDGNVKPEFSVDRRRRSS